MLRGPAALLVAIPYPLIIIKIFNGSKTQRGSKTRRQVHEAVINNFDVEFKQLPGHDDISPIGKYAGLRERTASEQLERLVILISLGTNHECTEMTKILTKPKEFTATSTGLGREFLDVKRIVTGRFENLAIGIIEPTARGQYRQYAAVRTAYRHCPNVREIYKTGGLAGPYDEGEIVVASETEGVVVYDQVLGRDWGFRPGFPGTRLKNASFTQNARRVAMATGPNLIHELTSKPYEIELSGFLKALENDGAFNDWNEIGAVGVVTENFGAVGLAQKDGDECFEDLRRFWTQFLTR